MAVTVKKAILGAGRSTTSPINGHFLKTALSAYLPNTDVTSSVSRYSVSSCTLPLATRKI
jgi:hypothetical protein